MEVDTKTLKDDMHIYKSQPSEPTSTMKNYLSLVLALALFEIHAQTVSLVKDINPGSASSEIMHVTVIDGRLVGTANGQVLLSDGTTAGTRSYITRGPSDGTNAGKPMKCGSEIVFKAEKIETGGHQMSRLRFTDLGVSTLWINPNNSDAGWNPNPGSVRIGDIAVDNLSLYVSGNLFATGSELCSYAYNPNNSQDNPSVDGFVYCWTGPKLVRDINPSGDSNPKNFKTLNGKTYFTAYNGTNGDELWVTDGTSAGTTLVKDIWPGTNTSGISAFVLMNSKLYFTADDGVKGRELWVTDGTTAGTVMVRDINIRNGQTLALIGSPNSESSNPTGLHVWKNKLYFSASNGTGGQELWSSDGTSAGTVLIKDINPNGGSNPKNFSGYIRQGQDPVTNQIVNQQYLSFAANDGTTGEELWRTDGTAAGTVLLKDVKAGTAGSSPSELRGLNTSTTAGAVSYTHYYYSAIGGNNGRELWEFHPLTNTHKKISPAVAPNPDPLKDSGRWPWVAMGTALYFYANFDSNGGELWKVTRP